MGGRLVLSVSLPRLNPPRLRYAWDAIPQFGTRMGRGSERHGRVEGSRLAAPLILFDGIGCGQHAASLHLAFTETLAIGGA